MRPIVDSAARHLTSYSSHHPCPLENPGPLAIRPSHASWGRRRTNVCNIFVSWKLELDSRLILKV
eukprot:9468001-Pyramimonas_sp.AAC.1